MHAKVGQPNRVQEFQHTTPMGRAGTPEEIAETIMFLLSDKSSFVTAPSSTSWAVRAKPIAHCNPPWHDHGYLLM